MVVLKDIVFYLKSIKSIDLFMTFIDNGETNSTLYHNELL